ncbi:response regulator transcription factor [Mangrovicoccus sp. HB161399]|uniref:response regulator transcription factor n=1 Tax=Mangrovicoccus sp. HB161399 TaxID=2720392 RepID=UPI001551BEC4|nr:response regulator transcription factor [Mangrovicoccus sp. HB161399]
MTRILVIEDEARLRSDLVDFLGLCGFEAQGAGTAAAARGVLAADAAIEVAILDVGLPDGNGFELAAEIRRTHACGIIMLTALGGSGDRIRGFESGADIYFVKDSTLREIEAGVRALLRRTSAGGPSADDVPAAWVLESSAWVLVSPDSVSVKLTATEYAFLGSLFASGSRACSREDLSRLLARPRAQFESRHLDTTVARLRRKIEMQTGLEAPIQTMYGVGYAFTAPAVLR